MDDEANIYTKATDYLNAEEIKQDTTSMPDIPMPTDRNRNDDT